MKSNMLLGLAVIGLSTLPVAGYAAQDSVSYDDSMKCASLYSYMYGEAEDDASIDKYVDLSDTWFEAAVARDGTEDGSRAEGEFEAAVEAVYTAVEGLKNAKAIKNYIAAQDQLCTSKQALIAE